jgi:hypothetical protein
MSVQTSTRNLCNRALHKLPVQGDFVSSPTYLTVEDVVERYRGKVSESTLANWRALRIGPSYIKIGKVPLYPVEELDRWDRSNLVSCRRSRSSGPEAVSAAKTVGADL